MPRSERLPSTPPSSEPPASAEVPKRRNALKKLKIADGADKAFDAALEPGMKELEMNQLETAEAKDMELFTKLADAKVEDLPKYMRELRGSLMLGLSNDEGRGLTDAQRMAAGLRHLRAKNPKRAAKLEETLKAYDFAAYEWTEKQNTEAVDIVKQDKRTKGDLELKQAGFEKQLDEFNLDSIPVTPLKKKKSVDLEAVGKKLLEKEKPKSFDEKLDAVGFDKEMDKLDLEKVGPRKRETITIPKSREAAHPEQKVIITPRVPEVAAQVEGHFLRTDALKSYVDYLDAQLSKKADLSQIELPTGEKFSDIGWSMDRIKELAHALNARLSKKEEAANIESLQTQIKGEPQDKRSQLQEQLNSILTQEERVKARIDELKGKQSLFDRMRGLFGGGNAKLQEYKTQLEDLETQRNLLEEDLQMSSYKQAIESTKSIPRKLAMTPKTSIETEAARREDRLEAEDRYGNRKGQSEASYEAEIMGDEEEEPEVSNYKRAIEATKGIPRKKAFTPASVLENEARQREDRLAAETVYGNTKGRTAESYEAEIMGDTAPAPEYDVDVSELESKPEKKPTKRYREVVDKLRKNPVDAARILPNAADLWEHFTKKLNGSEFSQQMEEAGPNVATEIILYLAAFTQATEHDDLKAAEYYQDAVMRLARGYGLADDPEFLSVYNGDEAPKSGPRAKPAPRTRRAA